MKKWMALLLALLLLASLPMTALAAGTDVEWTVSKSKTATPLDDQDQTTVTLSLPAADYKPQIDVVLVVDVSSSMKEKDIEEAKAAVAAMCDELAAKENVEVKVGIVSFDKTAHTITGLVSPEEAKEAISGLEASYDTNMMAGLIAGKAMLDADSSVDSADKYLVLMSDGIPIYWVEDGEPVSKTVHNYRELDENGWPIVTNSFPAGTDPEASENDLSQVMSISDILAISDWDSDSDDWYQNSDTGEIFDNGYKYTNIQKATYKTARYLQEEIFNQYQLITIAFGVDKYADNAVYQYGENFCDWIGENSQQYFKVQKPGYGGESGDLVLAFEEVADELIYVLGSGTVTDVIGKDFDLVSMDSFVLKLAGEALEKTVIDENTVAFGTQMEQGKYPYVVTYTAGENEYFVWEINVPVQRDIRVELSYDLKLVNKATQPGSYEADTNESATLDYVDSNGENPGSETFEKPKVQYVVEGESSSSSSSDSSSSSSSSASSTDSSSSQSSSEKPMPDTGAGATSSVAGLMVLCGGAAVTALGITFKKKK